MHFWKRHLTLAKQSCRMMSAPSSMSAGSMPEHPRPTDRAKLAKTIVLEVSLLRKCQSLKTLIWYVADDTVMYVYIYIYKLKMYCSAEHWIQSTHMWLQFIPLAILSILKSAFNSPRYPTAPSPHYRSYKSARSAGCTGAYLQCINHRPIWSLANILSQHAITTFQESNA